MKVIAIFGDAPNQAALAAKLFNIHGVNKIILVKIPPKTIRPSLLKLLTTATVGLPFRLAWRDLQQYYKERFDWPITPCATVPSANHPEVFKIIKNERPDLVLVSGTDLLSSELINIIRKGGKVMNLHTGISPYVKGGPNCTNWALHASRPDLIGNTIMWLDNGIDTGNIITTENVKNLNFRSLFELHLQVMEHAHDLYCRAFREVSTGKEVPSVSQESIAKGRLFLTKHWNARAMIKALINFQMIKHLKINKVYKNVKLVSLSQDNS